MFNIYLLFVQIYLSLSIYLSLWSHINTISFKSLVKIINIIQWVGVYNPNYELNRGSNLVNHPLYYIVELEERS